MRLKYLKLEHINSFEKATIDFEKLPEIYLVSGPTGSGKSTIFDAICGALYGKTPRANSLKELLMHTKSKGLIELAFEFDTKSFFIQRKITPSGVKSRLTIENEHWDKYIEREIQKRLKLDFAQFSQSVLLPQGKFDEFLNATPTSRAQILEQIIDMGEFERVGRAVYTYFSELEKGFEALKNHKERLLQEYESQDQKRLQQALQDLMKHNEELERTIKRIQSQKERAYKKEQLQEALHQQREKLQKIERKLQELKEQKRELSLSLQRKRLKAEELSKIYAKQQEALQKLLELFVASQTIFEHHQATLHLYRKLQEETQKLHQEIDRLQNKERTVRQKVEAFRIVEDERFEAFSLIEHLFREWQEALQKKEELLRHQRELQTQRELLTKQLDELMKIQNLLQKELEELQKDVVVLELQPYRAQLKDGEPCPLCGSLEHPYAKYEIDPKIKRRYEELQQRLKKVEKSIKEVEKELFQKETLYKKEQETLQELCHRCDEYLYRLRKYRIETKEEFLSLQSQRDEAKKQKALLEEYQKELEKILKELTLKRGEYQGKVKELQNKEKELQRLEKELQKRDQKPLTQILQREFSTKEEVEAYKRELEEAKEQAQKEYQELLRQNERLLEHIVQQELLQKEIAMKIQELQYSLQECEDVPEIALIEEELRHYQHQRDSNNQRIGRLNEQIEKLKRVHSELAQVDERLRQSERELERFERLNKIVGGKDGSAFKRRVQEVVLESLFFEANSSLDYLSEGRYTLVQEGEKIFVVDHFFEDQKRSVVTLSGGERFLVSLALSFGLSALMKGNVHIESLFIDEGFGTLDNQKLRIALEILQKIAMQSGIRIGIISHIEALKEEIAAGIVVAKRGSGISSIKIKEQGVILVP